MQPSRRAKGGCLASLIGVVRMTRRLTAALLPIATTLSAPARAQVTGQQGVTSVDGAKRFESPMVLTVPMPALSGVKEVHGLAVAGVRAFHCEDASIASMTVSASTARKGSRTYGFGGTLLVDASFDRLVSIKVELRDASLLRGFGPDHSSIGARQ